MICIRLLRTFPAGNKCIQYSVNNSRYLQFKYLIPVRKKSTALSTKRFPRTFEGPKLEELRPTAYLLLIIPAIFFGLGFWQVKRKYWKLDLIDKLTNNLNKPPIDLPQDLSNLKSLEYTPVRVKGRFDHSKELYLGPRPLKSDHYSPETGADSGFHVITPFILSDRDLTILVDRGWVPMNKKSPEKRQEGQIEDEIELTGVIRLHENRPEFGVKNKPELGYWYYRDLDNMTAITGASRVFLDASLESTIPGGPIGGQTNVKLRDDHVTYAITWFGLGVGSCYVWYERFKRSLAFVARK